jgi:signal transduction histidine kinase
MNEMSLESVLAVERQRILADLHDGLGASLVGLLQYVRSGQTDAASIERRVREALLEMRIAVDALRPSDGRLDAVLGNLRYRLEPLLQPVGVRLEWEVAELPRVDTLEPSSVFALQRIVLEAVANALKHAGATRIRISARATADGDIEIRIEDDGQGYDVTGKATGLGLTSMRARAMRIGAQLDIASQSGAGTLVRLLITRLLARPTEGPESGKPDPHPLHELVPAPRPA